jgi:trans-aconitate 2-methyltransferase
LVDWDAGQYLKFENERSRPAADLLRRVPLRNARLCVDLGCGPGNSTALLVERFPQAHITGLDMSADMIASARKRLPNLQFSQLDLQSWDPAEPLDLIYANAVLQWLPNHPVLLSRLASFLNTGGCLAIQMPDNLDEPSHQLMAEIARQGPWAEALEVGATPQETLGSIEDYYAWLHRAGCRIDIWRTTYVHALDGPGAIVEWFKATGLKRYLDPLPPDQRAGFLTLYVAEIARAYPPQADGKVLLRFPRLFLVAQRL